MSSLRTLDLNVISELVDFIRGTGYVLDFSDATFAEFFAAELDVDIEAGNYSDKGGSKGKRLRRFLQLVDDATAAKTLRALWEIRADFLLRTGMTDPVSNAEARYLTVIGRLGGGPSSSTPQQPPVRAFDHARFDVLKTELVSLYDLAPHPRGYGFERFLRSLFTAYGLQPRAPFENTGEQIDGSFVLGHDTYLLEAKWQQELTGQADLLVFEGKLGSKAAWARGLFVSYNGFTNVGLAAFGRGKRTICMHGKDIYDMLDRRIPFDEVIARKARGAVETGQPFIPVEELFKP